MEQATGGQRQTRVQNVREQQESESCYPESEHDRGEGIHVSNCVKNVGTFLRLHAGTAVDNGRRRGTMGDLNLLSGFLVA